MIHSMEYYLLDLLEEAVLVRELLRQLVLMVALLLGWYR